MKFINIIIVAFLMLGCDSKTEMVQPKAATTDTIKSATLIKTIPQNIHVITETPIIKVQPVVQYRTIQTNMQEVKTLTQDPVLPTGFKEETKRMPIKKSIPSSCQMWSDGCNTCTRMSRHQAECTVYKCNSNLKFSCLQWN